MLPERDEQDRAAFSDPKRDNQPGLVPVDHQAVGTLESPISVYGIDRDRFL